MYVFASIGWFLDLKKLKRNYIDEVITFVYLFI